MQTRLNIWRPLLAASLFACGAAPASAHAIAGQRLFPSTLTFDDPGIGAVVNGTSGDADGVLNAVHIGSEVVECDLLAVSGGWNPNHPVLGQAANGDVRSLPESCRQQASYALHPMSERTDRVPSLVLANLEIELLQCRAGWRRLDAVQWRREDVSLASDLQGFDRLRWQ